MKPASRTPNEGPPRPERILETIRRVAATSENVFLSEHAQDRMFERDISDLDVFRVLRKGQIKGRVENGKRAGEWKVKIVDQLKGSREAGVVTIVIGQKRLFVLTVEWEDIR